MATVRTWTRLSRRTLSSVAPHTSRLSLPPRNSLHTSTTSLKTKEKERTVFQTTDFIPPRTALFVSGSTSQFTTFVVDPHFDFDERFVDLEIYQKEINLRQLPFDLQTCSGSWKKLQALWNRRAELETDRKRSVANFSQPSDVSEESKLKGRLLRDEIKQLNKDIAEVEIDTITTLLKLPVRLRKDVLPGRGALEANTIGPKGTEPAERAHDISDLFQRSRLVEYSDEAPRGYFLRGEAAELELKLISYGRSFLEKKGYSGISGPHLYRSVIVEGTGFINDEHDDVAAPTGSSINAHSNQPILIDTVDSRGSLFRSLFLTSSPVNLYAAYLTNCEAVESTLPLRLHSSGRVYRSVGSKDLEEENEEEKHHRIFHPSQTHMVSFCTAFHDAGKTEEYLSEIVELLRSLYLMLGLDFRLVSLPAHQLGISEALRFNLEVWSTVLSEFVPCGHIAFHDDFISKRLRCHVDKPEQNKFLRVFTGSLMDLTPFVACCIDGSGDTIIQSIRSNPSLVL